MRVAGVHRFLHASHAQRAETLRFFLRKGLARIPFLPVRLRLDFGAGDSLAVWWSYVGSPFRAERRFADYWGNDLEELRFLLWFLRPGMSFFDVGAYHGLYTLVAATRLGGNGTLVAFEPCAQARRRLQVHLAMNGIPVRRAEAFAVGSSNGNVALYLDRVDPTMSGLRPHAGRDLAGASRVESIRLDDYCKRTELQFPDLIKVDVEGGEIGVVRGAEGLLTRSRPLLICEVLDQVTHSWGYPARQILKELESLHYQWFDFCPAGTLAPHTQRTDYPEVRNYLAVPREKISLVRERLAVPG